MTQKNEEKFKLVPEEFVIWIYKGNKIITVFAKCEVRKILEQSDNKERVLALPFRKV